MERLTHLGTKLDDNSIHITTGLRLGANIVEEHACICGALVDYVFPRHQTTNDHALVSDGVPSVFEPVGVCCEDGKCPNGHYVSHPLVR